jgi:hypothetical protein
MKIFDWIREYFEKFRSRFRKKKPEQILRDRIKNKKGTTQDAIRTQIEERVQQEDSISAEEISELAGSQTVVELQELLAAPTKSRIRVFDLVEIEQEVTALNKKLIEVQIKQKQIEPVCFPQTYKTDKDIEELEHILQKYDNKQNLTLSTSAIDKLKSRFGQFDKFLQDRILVKIYRIREEKRRKEEETKKQQVKELIGRIENLINHGNLQEAQSQLAKAAISISGLRNPEQKKSFREKLEALKSKFRERQIREEAKRQAEELKKQQEEAEQRRLAEEAKREEERKRREQEELIRKQQEEVQKKKEQEKRQALQRLLTKKSNWQDFAQVLQENGITILYHFTDRVNIASIKQNGGLFSWHYCDINGIDILRPGGSFQSRQNDTTNGKRDFVRLAFNKEHPMLYIAQKDERITSPVWLEIKIDVAFWELTEFADKNAAAFKLYTPNIGKDLQFLKNIRFDILNKAKTHKHYKLAEEEKPYNQAEVLVKTWIPIEFITNINQF